MRGGTCDTSASGGASGAPARLRPEMASRKLQVLAFIREYIGHWGGSPSFREIAAGCDTNVTRVKEAVRKLTAEGLLLRTPGPRGLALPTERDAALRVLKALGWAIDEDLAAAIAPAVTHSTLLMAPALDYVGPATGADDGAEEGASGNAGGAGHAREP